MILGRRRRGSGHRPQIVVYTRERCGLCREAERLVAAEAGRAEVRHVDIDADDDLIRRYTIRVPVITVDGVEVAEGQVEPGQVRRALRAARRGRPAR